MTMVMRPLLEGFSAHNAIPLVTDNGPRNCSLPVASPFLYLLTFFPSQCPPFSVIFTIAFDRFLLHRIGKPFIDSFDRLFCYTQKNTIRRIVVQVAM